MNEVIVVKYWEFFFIEMKKIRVVCVVSGCFIISIFYGKLGNYVECGER